MILDEVCPPAILYIAFSLTHIVIDLFKNLYNTAFLKFIVMIIFTLLLNILCQQGLDVVSWFIVFVPFIMMTVISSILLFMFGLHPSTGGLKYNVKYPNADRKSEQKRRLRKQRKLNRKVPTPYRDNKNYHDPSQRPYSYDEYKSNENPRDKYQDKSKHKNRNHRRYFDDVDMTDKYDDYDEYRESKKHSRRKEQQEYEERKKYRERKKQENEWKDGDWEWDNDHSRNHRPSRNNGDKNKCKSCNTYSDCDGGNGYCNTCSNGKQCCGTSGGSSGCPE